MDGQLTGKNALITGASRGLGARIARVFWSRGASVLLVGRTVDALATLQTDLTRTARDGQHVFVCVADLAAPDAAAIIMREAGARWGAVDILVNNAAILGPVGPAWENDWDAWQETLRVNLLAPVALCRGCVPRMIARGGGKIINLAGGGATGPRPHFSAYAAAKAGLVRFSETLAHEVAAYGIDVNCVSPGIMHTAMLDAVIAAGSAPARQAEYERAIREARQDAATVQPAALCAFLASAAGDGITGRVLSAVWDPWEQLPEQREQLRDSDIYTLRRIVPADRGMDWG